MSASFERNLLWVGLIFLFCGLQWRLWVGDGSLLHLHRLRQSVGQAEALCESLKARNVALEVELQYIKEYPEALEELARYELGMVREKETYYRVVEPVE